MTATEQNLRAKLTSQHRASIFESQNPIEISYNIKIEAKIKKQPNKVILHPMTGIIPAQSFTAILGPSGSGKTTLLNFLAGRLMSDNLLLWGEYRMNSVAIRSLENYSNQIGYVMQQDALLGTLTPQQCFRFAADLKLEMGQYEKQQRVDELIEELGLKDCRDVKIGNTFIKGVSGGERKRTSIGIELITNPNIIFLDEPTTGLDSTTAFQVIQLLAGLAKKGKTIVSTIHQPSSELFGEFDRLMLLVQGRCIYSGPAQSSYEYFAKIGYTCPELMNASQFYLDMMSLQIEEEDTEEIYDQKKQKFQQKIMALEQSYQASPLANVQRNESLPAVQVQKKQNISLFYELCLIFYRSLICQLRNPMDVGLKLIQAVFTAIVVKIIFGNFQEVDEKTYQNLKGIAFFLVSSNAFGGIQGTLATFSMERPVFIRERYSKTYSSIIYFLGRTMCSFPFDLIYPTVGVSIVYWSTGLGNQTFSEFLQITCVVNCCYFLSASYGLFYSTVIPKLETAMALVPVLIIPFMLLGGFFINLNDVHDIRVIFYPIMYLSPFKYGFQAIMLGLKSPFPDSYTPSTFESNIVVMTALGFGIRILALIAMQIVSSPKRPQLAKTYQTI